MLNIWMGLGENSRQQREHFHMWLLHTVVEFRAGCQMSNGMRRRHYFVVFVVGSCQREFYYQSNSLEFSYFLWGYPDLSRINNKSDWIWRVSWKHRYLLLTVLQFSWDSSNYNDMPYPKLCLNIQQLIGTFLKCFIVRRPSIVIVSTPQEQ